MDNEMSGLVAACAHAQSLNVRKDEFAGLMAREGVAMAPSSVNMSSREGVTIYWSIDKQIYYIKY